MILTCPNCGTQYVVKDGAIPPQGRQVRCAACKHSWHQEPEPGTAGAEAAEIEPATAPEPEPQAEAEEESVTEATLIEPRSGPEAEERAYEEAVVEEQAEAAPAPDIGEADAGAARSAPPADWREPPLAEAEDDQFSPFPALEEVEPRQRSIVLPILLLLIVVAAVAAAFWFYAPAEWKARLGVGVGNDSPLVLVTTHMDRRPLESGNTLLTVTGRIINPTNKEQRVPPLQAQIRSRAGRVVHSWTIAPPAQTLAPGASASFNSAEVNVPPGGEELTITLDEPRA